MKKSLYSGNYKIFLRTLKKMRVDSGLSQLELAELVGESQSFISKCERGERRIDVIELRNFCLACGISLGTFIHRLEKELN